MKNDTCPYGWVSFQTVEKLKISMSRKGLGNEACPKWKPQAEFISAEEKPRFQGFAEQILHEEIGLYSSVSLVKILILTKGVDFVDTLKRRQMPSFLIVSK